jgi:hypothetical protein
MTEVNVVQLARFNTPNYISNAEWTTTLKQPIIMNQGDSAVVSKSYLDTRLNTGGNIVIPNDIPLSITMYYYMMFPPDGTSLNTLDGTPPIDPPITSPSNGMPTNAPPALPAVSQLNPNDLKLWVSTFNETPVAGWGPYQLGTQPASGDNPFNNGVPVPPYVSFNSPPLYGYPQNTAPDQYLANTINQCWAGQMPLLLVTVPPPGGDLTTSIPFTKVWNYTLKAGSYSPDQLAEVITRAMASIQNRDTSSGNYTAYSQFGTTQEEATINSFLAKGQQIYYGVNSDPQSVITPYIDTVWSEGMLYSSNDPDFKAFVKSPQTNCMLASFVKGNTIPNQYLNYNQGNQWIENSNPLCFMQTKYQAGFTAINPVPQNIEIINYTSPVIGCTSPELVFNDQAGIFQFNYTHTPLQELPTGGGVPGQNTGTNPIEVVKIIKTINIDFTTQKQVNYYFSPDNSQVNITEHSKHSGVIFKKMEPVSFWSGILGFDLEKICVKQEEIWGPLSSVDFPRFNAITTSGFVGLNNNFNFNNIGVSTDNLNQPPYLGVIPLFPAKAGVSPEGTGELTYTNLLNSARWFGEQYVLKNNNVWTTQTGSNPPTINFPYSIFFPYFYEEYASALTATNPVSALRAPLSNVENVGHYLIEIVAYGGDKEFISNQTVYQVKNIVSSYYNSSGSFQTSPFPDSYVYTHTGETQIIHSFKVRIIDPYTMDTATTLGPSSSVYIQFNKALSQIATQQPS